MFGEYLGSLMAPWRRIKRPEFGAALTVLSIPGGVMMLNGMMGQAGGLFSGINAINNMAQGNSIDSALATARSLDPLATATQAATGAVATPSAEMLVNFPGLINGICLLLLYPYVRGRLLDMGYPLRAATIGTVLVQLSVLNDTLGALVGASSGPLPLGWMFGLFTFGAYILLTVKGSRARKVHDLGPSRHSQLDDDFPPP